MLFQKRQSVFLGLFRLFTRCFCRFLECLIRDVLWIAHIIIRHFTSAVITHKYSLPFYLGIFSSGLIQPLRDLIYVTYSTFSWGGGFPTLGRGGYRMRKSKTRGDSRLGLRPRATNGATTHIHSSCSKRR